MRLKLTLQHPIGQVLPINYQYLLSSLIYQMFGNADSEFATQLHERGYDFAGRQYKMFCFSKLMPAKYEINTANKTFILAESPTTLFLSFHIDHALHKFVVGTFKNMSFTLGRGNAKAQFFISGFETLSKPTFADTTRFRLITPLCVSTKTDGNNHATYLHPDDPNYANLLINNLLRKQQALLGQAANDGFAELPEVPHDFRVLTKPKSKLISIKGTKIRGWVFDFELSAPRELLEIGYYAGFGEKNSSLGFGMTLKI